MHTQEGNDFYLRIEKLDFEPKINEQCELMENYVDSCSISIRVVVVTSQSNIFFAIK